MKTTSSSRIPLGGKSAFNWRLLGIALPVILVINPFSEAGIDYGWVFWRWTLATLLGLIPLVLLFALGDFYFFQNRAKKPLADWVLMAYGFVMGSAFGISMALITYAFHLQNDDLLQQVLQRGISNGLAGMLLLPFSSLLSSSVEVYNSDREALIAERMLVESHKAESRAVIQSLRSSLSNKVDENLLGIIENSREYFDTKSRSLEENWELLAERLRRAALDTIRPFSHSLHRRGEEVTYRVRINELASYIAYKFDVHILLTLFIYTVLSHHGYIANNFQFTYLKAFLLKIAILALLLIVLKVLRPIDIFRKLTGFSALVTINSLLFVYAYNWAATYLKIEDPTVRSNIIDGLLIAALIILISLGMAFLNGGHAEIEFLERRISEEQLETMLLRREEARISRELAKYLHGTIQSRLMASAIGLESAGKRGDVKALKKEAKTAYRNLKLPSESYFSAPEQTLKAEIEKVIEKWQNLLTIKLSLPAKAPKLASDLIQDIGNVINEGLSNAFRHGSASQVIITIAFKDSYMNIDILDDGSGPTTGKGGLGSEWFDAIAGQNWELTDNPRGGALLHLKVPTR